MPCVCPKYDPPDGGTPIPELTPRPDAWSPEPGRFVEVRCDCGGWYRYELLPEFRERIPEGRGQALNRDLKWFMTMGMDGNEAYQAHRTLVKDYRRAQR